MLSLFVATKKVQKDRQVIKEADRELCLRTLQGSYIPLVLYVVATVIGNFYTSNPLLAILLGVLLVVITVARNLLLYRFEKIYSTGPARWRNQFFFLTLLLAALWSVILTSHLFVVGIDTILSILWFYTSIFSCAATLIYAPYNPFFRYLIVLTIIPSAIATLILQTAEGFLYSAIFWGFYLFLNKFGSYYEELYWDRLSVNFSLKQKTVDLEIARRNSEDSKHLKNEFLSNMSHEFRTPLNDALGALSILDDTALSVKQKELLSVAEKSSENLLALVDNILDYSRITSEAIVLDSVVFNVRRLVEQSIEDLVSQAHQRHIELSYIFQKEVPLRVRGDPARLGQIISNLISNAIKFSQGGNIIIYVTMDRIDKNYGKLRIAVEDEGPGISVENENVVFNAFSKVDTQLNEKVGGTGLGLAICKGLVEKMLGEIGFDSKPGVGTTFWFTVDLLIATNQDQTFSANPKLKGKRLILVNLPEKILASRMEEFANWGFNVKGVKDVDCAREEMLLAVNSGQPYDLVIMNMVFAGDKTLEFSRFLVNHKELRKTSQILIASLMQRALDEMHEHIRLHAQCECLTKPVRRVKLHEIMVQLLVNGASKYGKSNIIIPKGGAGKRKVLLVEDHKVNQMITRGMLDKLGYSVKVVNNGKEALGILDEQQFDLILMDCQMPVMDGYEAAIEIRKREETSGGHIPIVAMTAYAAEEDESRCLSAGMDDYLAKPVKLDELRVRLEHWDDIYFSKAG